MKLVNSKEQITRSISEVYQINNIYLFLYKEGQSLNGNVDVRGYNIYRKEDVVIEKTNVYPKDNANCYFLYNDEVLKKIKTKPLYDTLEDKDDNKISVQEIVNLKDKDFKPSNILYFQTASHLIFQINKEEPLTGVYTFSIEETSDKYYNLNGIEKILKKSKKVISYSREEIPYYNCDYDGQEGIAITLIVTQKDIDKIWNKVKDYKYPSVKLKEEILCRYRHDIIDPLGLNKYKHTDEEVEKLELSYENDDDDY